MSTITVQMRPTDFYEAEGETLHRDVYPAEVAMPDGSVLTGVHVFVTSHRLLVYGETGQRQVGLIFGADLETPRSVPASMDTMRAGQLECKLGVGGTAWINVGRGCGCGSPLKAMASPVGWVRR